MFLILFLATVHHDALAEILNKSLFDLPNQETVINIDIKLDLRLKIEPDTNDKKNMNVSKINIFINLNNNRSIDDENSTKVEVLIEKDEKHNKPFNSKIEFAKKIPITLENQNEVKQYYDQYEVKPGNTNGSLIYTPKSYIILPKSESRRTSKKKLQSLETNRIVGGKYVRINKFSYQANYDDKCGGALIHKKWVLTASHCTDAGSYIRLGSSSRMGGKMFRIKRHYKHPNWTMDEKLHAFDYDLQLLELRRQVKLTDKIEPIKIGSEDLIKEGKFVTVTGWGLISEKGPLAEELRAVNLPITNFDECNRVKNDFYSGKLTERMFCAGFIDQDKDACQGDSGGPATIDDRLVGIVSFGIGCARAGLPGVYTKIPLILPWILNVTKLRASDIS